MIQFNHQKCVVEKKINFEKIKSVSSSGIYGGPFAPPDGAAYQNK
jgi:hypothetical protein